MAGGPSLGPLVGRTAELARLLAAVRAAAGGHGGVVLVEGEAGIGKSRLVAEAAAAAAEAAMQVCATKAEQLDSGRPFGLVAEALGVTPDAPDQRRAEVAGHLFGERSAELHLVEELVALAEDLCAEGPLAIVVDDVHWADPSSLRVLHRLARTVDQLPLLLLIACRTTPRTGQLAALASSLRDRGSPSMRLGALEPAAVTELVSSVMGAAPGPRLALQAEAAGGNPLFVTELLATLRTSGSVTTTSDGVAEIGTVALPPALGVTVLHRLSFLPEEVLDALRTASILGRSFAVTDLAVVTGRSAAALLPALRQAIEARILEDDGNRVSFRHDLLRDTLYDDLPGGLRVAIHRDVAVALAAHGAPAVQVAEHFVQAAALGDAVAVEWLHRAAEESAVRSPGVAADLLGRAVELMDPADPALDIILADRALSLELSGRTKDAAALCRQLLRRHPDAATEARTHLCLSRILSGGGEFDEALEEATAAAEIPGLTATQRARVLANASSLPLGIPHLGQAEDLARPGLSDDDAVVRANSALTMSAAALCRGRIAEALSWAAEAEVARDDAPGERMAQGLRHLQQGVDFAHAEALLGTGRGTEAAAALSRARRVADEFGFRDMLARAHTRQAVHCYSTGAWDETLAEADALADLAADVDVLAGSMVRALGVRALVALHRGDLSAARDSLATAERYATGHPYDDHFLWLGRTLLAEAAGSAGDHRSLAARWEQCTESGVLAPCPALGPDLVRSAMAAGADAIADAAATLVEELAAASPEAVPLTAAALRCRGLRDRDPAVLVAAADAGRDGALPLEHALACEQAAGALGSTGRPDEAQALFDEANAGFERLEAVWDLNRTTARMRSLGMRRVSRQPRRPRKGWEALTPSELAVVELVAQGLSNPQIAERVYTSRRTVRAHVSNALAKLDFTSRVELAGEATRRNQASAPPAPVVPAS